MKIQKSGAKLSAGASRWANRGAISPGDPREGVCMTAEQAGTTIGPQVDWHAGQPGRVWSRACAPMLPVIGRVSGY